MRILAAAMLASAMAGSSASPPIYEAIRLLPPDASEKTGWSTTDLNADGMVVGYSFRHAFRWTPEQGYALVHTGAAERYGAVLLAVDDAGTAVGSATFDFPYHSATIFPAAGGVRDIGALLPEASFSEATSLSSAGHVAGRYWATVDGESVQAAFVWNAAQGLQRIGDTEEGFNPFTVASGVNNAGHVVGTHRIDNNSGFVWSRESGIVDIAGTSQAHAINDHEEVVGEAYGTPSVAFILDRHSRLVLLPSSDRATRGCDAMAVNDLGQVVGTCLSSQYGIPAHAMLWWPEAGDYEAVDLNAQLGIDDGHFYKNCGKLDDNGAGSVDFKAVGINDSGRILVQVECSFTYDTAQLTVAYGTLLLTPQAGVRPTDSRR